MISNKNTLTVWMSLGLLMLLGACAKQVEKSVTKKLSETETVTSQITNHRRCTGDQAEIKNTTPSKIGAFFGKVVRNLEGPPTYCVTINTRGGANDATGTLRLEYEDDFGIRYYIASESQIYYGSLVQGNDPTTIEIVFNDGAGFVQVKATENSQGLMIGTIKYYNFPSYQEGINQAAAEAAAKCKNGTYTVAQCLGYNFAPTKWWESDTYALSPREKLLKAAKAILNDANKTTLLGNIEFDLGTVLTQ